MSDENDSDFLLLNQAVSSIEAIARQVNESKRDTERRTTLGLLQQRLKGSYPPLIADDRALICKQFPSS